MRLRRDLGQHRAVSDRLITVMLVMLAMFNVGVVIVYDTYEQFNDTPFDATVRPTDPGGDVALERETQLPDLITIRMGGWQPVDPAVDLFDGSFEEPDAPFVRIEIKLNGLINPPGPCIMTYDPYRYGTSPVYGFVEIDIDDDTETGGETDSPQYRYLSNVARFGGMPNRLVYRNRCAREGADIDDTFVSPPQIERHGEEFHIAFLGKEFDQGGISFCDGDDDLLFEAGETWQITGTWFHRAHGFEPFSFAEGGGAGEYMPVSTIEFAHSSATDTTTISVVFPLTNAADAVTREEPVQPNNADPTDQASVEEGLEDLVDSGMYNDNPGNDPAFILIEQWGDQIATDYLDPRQWQLTCLLGTLNSFPEAGGPYFIWTDVFPDVVRGDFNGNLVANGGDSNDLEQL